MNVTEFKPQEQVVRGTMINTDINIITRDKKVRIFAFNKSGRNKLSKMIDKYDYFEIEYKSDTELILYLKKDKTDKSYNFIKSAYSQCSVKLYSTYIHQDPKNKARNQKLNDDLKALLDTGCNSIPYNITKIKSNVVFLVRDKSLPFSFFVPDPLLPVTEIFINNFNYVRTHTV